LTGFLWDTGWPGRKKEHHKDGSLQAKENELKFEQKGNRSRGRPGPAIKEKSFSPPVYYEGEETASLAGRTETTLERNILTQKREKKN